MPANETIFRNPRQEINYTAYSKKFICFICLFALILNGTAQAI